MTKVLVLCTGNSCRSQMAHGWLNKFAADQGKEIEVVSAGIETHGLNPRAVQVMAEAGVPIDHHNSELIDMHLNTGITHAITVCDNAKESCPIFPEQVNLVHHSFNDPAGAAGTEEEILTVFRTVRDEIRDYCENYVTAL